MGEYNARYLVVVRLRGPSLTENRKYSNGSHSKKPHLVTVASVFTQEAPPSFKVESKFKDAGKKTLSLSRDLRVQVSPSPLYPFLQRQTYEPSVLVHIAFL